MHRWVGLCVYRVLPRTCPPSPPSKDFSPPVLPKALQALVYFLFLYQFSQSLRDSWFNLAGNSTSFAKSQVVSLSRES